MNDPAPRPLPTNGDAEFEPLRKWLAAWRTERWMEFRPRGSPFFDWNPNPRYALPLTNLVRAFRRLGLDPLPAWRACNDHNWVDGEHPGRPSDALPPGTTGTPEAFARLGRGPPVVWVAVASLMPSDRWRVPRNPAPDDKLGVAMRLLVDVEIARQKMLASAGVGNSFGEDELWEPFAEGPYLTQFLDAMAAAKTAFVDAGLRNVPEVPTPFLRLPVWAWSPHFPFVEAALLRNRAEPDGETMPEVRRSDGRGSHPVGLGEASAE